MSFERPDRPNRLRRYWAPAFAGELKGGASAS